jgi:hypothetical protein
MNLQNRNLQGIRQLVQKYEQEFRIPENLNYYAVEDYRIAEKHYVKFCLKNGCTLEMDSSKHSFRGISPPSPSDHLITGESP